MIYFGLLFALPGTSTGKPTGSPRTSGSPRGLAGSSGGSPRVEAAELPGGNRHIQSEIGLQASSSLRRDSATRDLPSVELTMTKDHFFAKIDGIYPHDRMPEIQRQNLLAEYFTHTKANEFNQRLLSELQPGQLQFFPKELSKDLTFKEHPELFLTALGSKRNPNQAEKDMLMDIVRSITPETQLSTRTEIQLATLFYRYKVNGDSRQLLYTLLDLYPSQLKKLIDIELTTIGLKELPEIKFLFEFYDINVSHSTKFELVKEYINSVSFENPTGLSLRGQESIKNYYLEYMGTEISSTNRQFMAFLPLEFYKEVMGKNLKRDLDFGQLKDPQIKEQFIEFTQRLTNEQVRSLEWSAARNREEIEAIRAKNSELNTEIATLRKELGEQIKTTHEQGIDIRNNARTAKTLTTTLFFSMIFLFLVSLISINSN